MPGIHRRTSVAQACKQTTCSRPTPGAPPVLRKSAHVQMPKTPALLHWCIPCSCNLHHSLQHQQRAAAWCHVHASTGFRHFSKIVSYCCCHCTHTHTPCSCANAPQPSRTAPCQSRIQSSSCSRCSRRYAPPLPVRRNWQCHRTSHHMAGCVQTRCGCCPLPLPAAPKAGTAVRPEEAHLAAFWAASSARSRSHQWHHHRHSPEGATGTAGSQNKKNREVTWSALTACVVTKTGCHRKLQGTNTQAGRHVLQGLRCRA